MIGTTRLPTCSSRARLRRRLVNAIVVDTSWPPEPPHISANAEGSGSDSSRRTRVVRFGIEPSSARRRSIMYWYSTESSDGLKYGGSSASIELSGISSCMYSRSRRSTICCLVIFLIWCVELRPSKPSPRVHPLTVLQRITVGAPDPRFSVAALYAA
jgi:hypothetical protein